MSFAFIAGHIAGGMLIYCVIAVYRRDESLVLTLLSRQWQALAFKCWPDGRGELARDWGLTTLHDGRGNVA